MKVFINPGHAPNGVPDPGACGRLDGDLYYESDIAHEVGFSVAQYLMDVGIECLVFQNDSLSRICERANLWGADIFLSIHANAGGGVGTETYCYAFGGRSHALAECIQKQIVDSCDMVDRKVKEKGYYVLVNTNMCAVLVELGFMDSEEDLDKMLSEPEEFSRAIARGVTDYIQSLGD